MNDQDGTPEGEPKMTPAQQQIERLVDLGEKRLTLHVDGYGSPYALEEGSADRRPLRRAGALMARIYREAEKHLPSPYAIRNALEVLAETARSNGLGPGDDDRTDEYLEAMAKEGEQPEPVKSVATQLVEMALDDYQLGCTPDGEPYAVPRSGPQIVRQLRGGRQSLRAELARRFFETAGMAASQSALADACTVLEGMAQQEEPAELHLRVARWGDAMVLDLGDATGRAVVIDCYGWRVVDQPPALFRRTALTGELPEPKASGDLGRLWEALNVAEKYQPILLGVLVCELIPHYVHPVVLISGEHGTGKTTATARLAGILDPSTAQVRKKPRDVEAWTTAAAGSWVVALDNLSDIPDWLSDALCRASTGDGDVRRRLYSDGDLHVLAFRRCVFINGIDVGVLNSDLADRLVQLVLELIPEDARLSEEAMAQEWRDMHPDVLGGLLDLTEKVLAELPAVTLGKAPRMVDFARVLAAVDKVRKTNGLAVYRSLAGELARETAASDPVLVALAEHVTKPFTGTAAELLAKITPIGEDGKPLPARQLPEGWPKTARSLTAQLTRQSPVLRRLGWTVAKLDKSESARGKAVQWQLTPPGQLPPPDPREGANPAANAAHAANDPLSLVNGSVPGAASGAASAPNPERDAAPAANAAPRGNDAAPHAAPPAPPLSSGNEDHAASAASAASVATLLRPPARCALCGLVVAGPFDHHGRCRQCTTDAPKESA